MSIRDRVARIQTEWKRWLGASKFCGCCGWTFRGCEWGNTENRQCRDCGVCVGRFEYRCGKCEETIRQRWLNDLRSLPLSNPSTISREEYDRLMREMQEPESAPPAGVIRSATFSVCQGVTSKPSESPKLELKVQK